MMLSTIPAPQLVLPTGSSVLRWKCRQLGLHPACSAHPFGTAWPLQSWAGTGSSAGTAPSLCPDSHDAFHPHFPGIIY